MTALAPVISGGQDPPKKQFSFIRNTVSGLWNATTVNRTSRTRDWPGSVSRIAEQALSLCMAVHKRLHIADPEVGELAERLAHLLGKNKTESLREVLREKVESLGRAHTAQQRNRAILALVDQKLPAPPAPLSKQEIEEIVGL